MPEATVPETTASETARYRRGAGRLAWLDALRGFAALCVVYDHGSTLVLQPSRGFLYHVFNFGQYGVFVFFLVSGYIVPASLERKGSVRSFWISRAFRLYPMYLVALMLAALAYWTGYGTIMGAEHHPLTSAASWLLMLPNLLTGANVPNVTWTLSYEMVFYLLLAALFSWRIHRFSGGYATACAVAALALGGVLPMAAITHAVGQGNGPAHAEPDHRRGDHRRDRAGHDEQPGPGENRRDRRGAGRPGADGGEPDLPVSVVCVFTDWSARISSLTC
jgi:peptidoglycan/LPS O-acetylase OafA/YrhL